ncbi:MAG: monothiol glutaredoxin grx5 [Phylliscum demangeonii]|nr:MAG: monothiol glutaredoxin grx5 [Phylliscum demangeonii]
MLARAAVLSHVRHAARPARRPPNTSFVWASASASASACAPRLAFAFAFASRALSTETRSAIDKAVASAPVVLFMKGTPEVPQCGFSRASVQILGLQGVDPTKFAAYNVLEDAGLRDGIKEYSDWPTIPQLYVNKNFVGGCDILVSMHQNGELAKMLEDEKVLAKERDASETS